MQKNESRSKDTKEKQKDYYVSVTVCQILLCALLLGILALVLKGSGSDTVKNQLNDIMTSKIEYEDVSAAVSEYIGNASSWAVFGDNISYSETTKAEEAQPSEKEETVSAETTDETTSEEVPMGGRDVKAYEAKTNTSFAPYKVTAKILNPIESGRYTSLFGYRTNPITGEFTFHTGLDIAAPKGSAIRAAWNGTVTKVGEDSQAGKYIFLEHNDGFVTFYCHCSEIVAVKGAVIRQGETIAFVGSTGWSTGPHLHFEIRKDNIRLNPMWALEDDA